MSEGDAAARQKGVNWCFTINHWTEDDKDRIEAAQALGAVLEPLRRRFKVKHFSAVAADACVLPPQ